MKKTVILLLAIVLLATALTGCAKAEVRGISGSQAIAAVYSSMGVVREDTAYTVVTADANTALPCYDVELMIDGGVRLVDRD